MPARGQTAAPPCRRYPWVELAVLDFLRRIAFAFAMLYMLARLHNMQLWRGKGALDADVSGAVCLPGLSGDAAVEKYDVFCILGAWLGQAYACLLSTLCAPRHGGRHQRTCNSVAASVLPPCPQPGRRLAADQPWQAQAGASSFQTPHLIASCSVPHPLQPDRMLTADQPWRTRARAHVVILFLWAILVTAAAMAMTARVRRRADGCGELLLSPLQLWMNPMHVSYILPPPISCPPHQSASLPHPSPACLPRSCG